MDSREHSQNKMENDLNFVDVNTADNVKVEEFTTNCLDELPPKKKKALTTMRQRLQDVIKSEHDDFYLLKWLKARCFDVDKAENMFRESLKYKEEICAESLIETYKPPEVLLKYRAGGNVGFDKEGSPVIIDLFGRLDMKGLMYSTKRSDLEKNQILHCELNMKRCREQSENLGRRIDGVTVIFDMEGVSTANLWRPGIQMYLYLVKVLEDNYPEMMKRMFVINAPSYLNLFWTMCKPLVSDDMRKKILICKADYKDVLVKYIDRNQLPVCLGGTRTGEGGDETCSNQIIQGGLIPKEYYLSDSKYLDTMECDTLQPGEKISVTKQVENTGSILSWEFRTDDHDVAFGITYKSDETSKEQEVVPMRRIKSHQIMEDGTLSCDKTGIYNLIFSNCHSWFTSKIVYHKIDIL